MDLKVIKQRLESLTTQNKPSVDYSSIFWKPTIGKQVIRVVPSKYNKENPFTELKVYYGIGKKVMASPMNWGEKDPIVAFTKQLRATNDTENWKLAKKLDPKTRICVPVIVRGDEEAGVRLWQFGKETYQDFLNLAIDDEIGDFTDVMEGRDIKLTTVGPEVTGTVYNKTTISPSLKSSSLSEDSKVIEKWLEDQPDPLKTFKQFTYDEVKQALQEYLSPDEDGDEDPIVPAPKKTPSSNYSLKEKKTKSDKFDDLFEEDGSKEDDLPF